MTLPAAFRVCEKLPWRSSNVGTVVMDGEPLRLRYSSQFTKKNVLSLLIGPPNEAPY
jgi:hypothetical protein